MASWKEAPWLHLTLKLALIQPEEQGGLEPRSAGVQVLGPILPSAPPPPVPCHLQGLLQPPDEVGGGNNNI